MESVSAMFDDVRRMNKRQVHSFSHMLSISIFSDISIFILTDCVVFLCFVAFLPSSELRHHCLFRAYDLEGSYGCNRERKPDSSRS